MLTWLAGWLDGLNGLAAGIVRGAGWQIGLAGWTGRFGLAGLAGLASLAASSWHAWLVSFCPAVLTSGTVSRQGKRSRSKLPLEFSVDDHLSLTLERDIYLCPLQFVGSTH